MLNLTQYHNDRIKYLNKEVKKEKKIFFSLNKKLEEATLKGKKTKKLLLQLVVQMDYINDLLYYINEEKKRLFIS